MKSIIRKAISVSAAMALSAVSISSVAAEGDAINGNINKPYLNINVTGEDTENLEYKLVDSEGNTVASWIDGDFVNADVSGVENITGITDLSELATDTFTVGESYLYGYNENNSKFKSFDVYKDGELLYIYARLILDFELREKYCISSTVPETLDLQLGHTYTLDTNVYENYEQTDLTIDAGEYAVIVDSAYADKTYTTGVGIGGSISNPDSEYAFETMTSGVNIFNNLPVGTHKLYVTRPDGAGGGSGDNLTVYDHSTDYVKVTANIGDLTNGYFNTDGTIDHTSFDVDHHIDPRLNDFADGIVAFYFHSGSVITAAIPDENGNVEVYVNKEDYNLQYSITFDTTSGSGGGRHSSCKETRPLKTLETVVDTNIDIPESGLTLYNISAGDYTVEIDSAEYTLENNTITVTDAKDLQSLNVVLKKIEEPSSSETSSDSDDTSSVTDSETSSSLSSASSSSSKAANTSNTANPSTGAAAGFAGMALIAGAAVVVSKKKH